VPETASFRAVLEAQGVDPDNIIAEFVFEESIPLGGD
jgi:hypothetical protein